MSGRAWFYSLTLSAMLWITLFLGTSKAQMPQPHQLKAIQTAWPGSPCTNRIRVYWDYSLESRQITGEASGIRFGMDGASWQRISCDIALNPQQWAKASRIRRAKVLLHEAGHLAGYVAHSEDPSDVMFYTSLGCRPFCGRFHLPSDGIGSN